MVKTQNDHKILVGLISLIGHERDSHVMDDGNVANAPTTLEKKLFIQSHFW
jgi:hypothetical protein